MDYSWLEIVKKSLDSLDELASRLKGACTGETINDSQLRMIVGEIEENTSRVSRLLLFEKNRGIFSKYHITPPELYLLTPRIDDGTRKCLLRGDRKVLDLVADRLSEAIRLWRERIIQPSETETPVSQKTANNQFQNDVPIPDCKVLLLLGAGASRPLQLPTMADFWQVMQANCNTDEEKLAMSMLLNAAKDETTHLPPDLERVLMMLDRYNTYFDTLWEDPHFGLENSMRYRLPVPFQPLFPWSREKPLEQFMRRCGQSSMGISRIMDMVTRLMDTFYTKQLDEVDVVNLYRPLFSLLNDHFGDNRTIAFTTNYDTAIEQYCRYEDMRLLDGFQRMGPSLVWNPAQYHQELDPDVKAIMLFKLHGSLTWRKIGNEIIEFGMSASSMPGDTALIYPTETKEYPYEEPFKTAYQFLGRFLKTAEVAIVIGYSFRDRGITYIIDEAQSINPSLKFIVVCGEKPEDATRRRFPYGSQVIQHNLESGDNPKYLVRLDELISDISEER